MADIECFMIRQSGATVRYLRRYASGSQCPVKGYHDARTELDVVGTAGKNVSGDIWSHDDERWPTQCECSYTFTDGDTWQLFHENLYARMGDPARLPLSKQPPGAMWLADWLPKNPYDDMSLVLMTPGGEWWIDGPSDNGEGWTRTGTPPHITASPSIGKKAPDGSWAYHGWLRDGKLVDA